VLAEGSEGFGHALGVVALDPRPVGVGDALLGVVAGEAERTQGRTHAGALVRLPLGRGFWLALVGEDRRRAGSRLRTARPASWRGSWATRR
jgi:hypothetical protein